MTLRRAVVWAVRISLTGGMLAAFCSDRFMLEKPEGDAARYRLRIADRLREKWAVASLLTFDEPRIMDWAKAHDAEHFGVRRTPGRYGDARLFDGSESSFVTVPIRWKQLGRAFTMSLWIRTDPRGSSHQTIVGDEFGHGGRGLWLDQGMLRFAVANAKEEISVETPFVSDDDFSHVAVVVDTVHKRLALYVGGVLRAEKTLDALRDMPSLVMLGRNHPIAPNHFFRGALDEFVLFTRALDDREVAALSAARSSRLPAWAGSLYGKLRMVEGRAAFQRFVLKSTDLFSPFLHVSRIPRDLPAVRIAASEADVRALGMAAARADRDGDLGAEPLQRRRVSADADGHVGPAWIGVRRYGKPVKGARETYRLDFEDGRGYWLIPPESCGILMPIMAAESARRAGAPEIKARFCALTLRHRFKGVYLLWEGALQGVSPDGQWEALKDWAFGDPKAREIEQSVRALYESVLCHDTTSPLSARELRRAIRKIKHEAAAHPKRSTPSPTEFWMLGENVSPDYVSSDLRLPLAASFAASEVRWTSDRPEVMDSAGRVARPAGERPVGVNLTADWDSGAGPTSRVFHFRVMPESPPVLAVALDITDRLHSFGRVDGVGRLLDVSSATGDVPRVGGVKYRGRTGLFKDKKSYSLRFESPPGWIKGSDSPVVYLMSCYWDDSFMRDRFATELFRSMGSADDPRYAVHGRPAEVFVNGRYEGLYSMSERVDRYLLGWGPYQPGPDQPFLYRAHEEPSGFDDPSGKGYLQVDPPAEHVGAQWGPLRELLMRTSPVTPDDLFAREIPRRMNLRCLADFFLLLNVTDNRDGEIWNFYLGRTRESDTWFMVPWDFDQTLRGTAIERSNSLFERLERCVPEYPPLLRARWRELRAGPLADEALAHRVEALARPVRIVAEWDHRRWPDHVHGEDPWALLQVALKQRIQMLDRRLEEN